MKFISFDVTHGGTARRIVVAFPNDIVHSDMAAGVEHALRMSMPTGRVYLVGAGEATAKIIALGGHSSTLDLGPAPDKLDLPSFNGCDYSLHTRSI